MKFLIKLTTVLLYIEHFIYCATDCKVELPIHKRYYQHRREVYENYLMEKPVDIL